MIQLSSHKQRENKKVLNKKIPSVELISHKVKRMELGERCRVIFEKIRPQLIEDYENWFIAIEAENETYLIASQLKELIQKIKQKYPDNEVKMTIFQLNQLGTCGKI